MILNARHLKRTLASYFAYYHESRTHLGLDKQSHFLGRSRVSEESSRSRNSAVCIIDMNALPLNNISAEAFLAKNTVVLRSPSGVWSLNGIDQHLDRCVDLDLGFTPATNLLQLRRMALKVGESADTPVAWLDVPASGLDILHQRYERRTDNTYWYEAPRFDYRALLETNSVGFIRFYPGLWQVESRPTSQPSG